MPGQKKIKSALISVFYKDGLDKLVKVLHELDVTIYSTGGTQKYIEDLGIPVMAVEDLTSYPSILGGRVKTLHPKVFGGILARRNRMYLLLRRQHFSHEKRVDAIVVCCWRQADKSNVMVETPTTQTARYISFLISK